ncbi:SIS domain-containing protein [Nakamurella lactea]|uniref:SIS domain-containing protein n=1 Tax=Nakamurella lactea TaxID=459515 RepID=UPI000424E8B4|nr:SIS domain-containing protein [Nakamurella lactea]
MTAQHHDLDAPAAAGAGRHVLAELASQPDVWSRAVGVAAEQVALLPQPGERIAVVGCGTSAFIAQSYAVYREQAGGDVGGETDAFYASEFPAGRSYDLLVAITRSGTTTEVLELLAALPESQRTLIIVGDADSPGARAADAAILLPFADEKSVVQTRFATTALALLRAGLGHDLAPLIEQGRAALQAPLPTGWQHKVHFTYLGHGPGVGLANEAALKMREAAIAWAESYPAYDYRHGPIAVAEEHSLVWIFGEPPAGLIDQIEATGATVETAGGDPLADLVRAQRLAIELALYRGYDPDSPRNLTRSIILES